MKPWLWIVAAIAVVAAFLALTIAVTSSSDSSSPTPTSDVARLTATATPFETARAARSPIGAWTDNSTAAPTPTAPLGCSFGSGIWEQCAKTAADPAIADFGTRYVALPNSLAVTTNYVEWPDSCLGVETPDVVCAQVITPGFRVILQAAGTPFVEYHTDLSGRAIFARTYEAYQDIPSVPPTDP